MALEKLSLHRYYNKDKQDVLFLMSQICVTMNELWSQISSHVQAMNSIYQITDFKGMRNIGFMVKRIRVSCISRKAVLSLHMRGLGMSSDTKWYVI